MVGDERKFKQVLLNLLSNAVKFTPEGGRVVMRAAPRTTRVEVSVADTGIGIAPRTRRPSSEEFRQVGTDYARKREGTGLGLALARRFVGAARRPDLGEERGGAGIDVHLHASGAPMAGELILIVEDNEKNRKLERDRAPVPRLPRGRGGHRRGGRAPGPGVAARAHPHGHPAPGHQRHRGAHAGCAPSPTTAPFP